MNITEDKSVKPPCKKLYSFRFDPTLIKEIDTIAKDSHRNRTQLLTDLMVEHKKEVAESA